MHRLGRVLVIAVVSELALLPTTKAQELNLGHQTMPGYYAGPSPTFQGYQGAPVIGGVAHVPETSPPLRYEPAPSYQTSVPRYLPLYGGGMAGGTFKPGY